MRRNTSGGPRRQNSDLETQFGGLRVTVNEPVVLDSYNSDLNLVIDPTGCGAATLHDPEGFQLLWAGARATHGVCTGKAFFEMKVVANFNCASEFLGPHRNVARLGWSTDKSSMELGEEPWSFGYGGTGKFSTQGEFNDYGQSFTKGDVIGAMLNLDSNPAKLSFTKNGQGMGAAKSLKNFPVGDKDRALFPHIFLKNCKVELNFTSEAAWIPAPPGYTFLGDILPQFRVRATTGPTRTSECEIIMMIGLPGCGKTTWAQGKQRENPEKRYNILGTNVLIDKMKVIDLTRGSYKPRFDKLYQMANKCLEKILNIAATRKRNYILDQTNVYSSARQKKMAPFAAFQKVAAVLQPSDSELQSRTRKRTSEQRKEVPASAVCEMKANFTLPDLREKIFDRIEYLDLGERETRALVRRYNSECAGGY